SVRVAAPSLNSTRQYGECGEGHSLHPPPPGTHQVRSNKSPYPSRPSPPAHRSNLGNMYRSRDGCQYAHPQTGPVSHKLPFHPPPQPATSLHCPSCCQSDKSLDTVACAFWITPSLIA